MPFCFDVLAQLANIPARITFYKLLRLSKSTREALADSEALITQIPARHKEEDEGYCLQISKRFPYKTFTPEDMQSRGKMIDPCITQVLLDHLKCVAFRLTQDQC